MKKIRRRDFIKSIGLSLVGGSLMTSNKVSSETKTQFKNMKSDDDDEDDDNDDN